jgi:HAD superfamily hydrolase (TIGR01549 family)
MRASDASSRSDPSSPAPANPAAGPGAARARPAVRLVLFDLDDTLCDYAAARAARLRIAFGHALAAARRREARATGALRDPAGDRSPDLDALIAASIAIHPHGADHFPELLRPYGVSPEAAALAVAWYRANRFHGLALFADAIATLEAVRLALPGGRLGLITNGPADIQRAKIEQLGLAPLVDFALVSGELGIEKPDPAIFREALRRGGAIAAEAIFVGDSPDHDIAGARAAGIRAVWMNRTGRPWPAPLPPPDDEVRDLAAFLALLGATAPVAVEG